MNSAIPTDVLEDQGRNKEVCYSVGSELTFELRNLVSALWGMKEKRLMIREIIIGGKKDTAF